MRPTPLRFVPFLALLLVGCDGGNGPAGPVDPARVVLSIDGEAQTPDVAVVVPPLPYAVQIGTDRFGAKHRLTTPANEPFSFDLVSWSPGAQGGAMVSCKHVGSDGRQPESGLVSMARAGIAPAGTGMWDNEGWLSVSGDGFARLTLQGRIAEEQVLAVTNESGGMTLIVLAIGARSAINQADPVAPQHPGVISRDTIYSSDAWDFGLPTIAVSGDRSTVVAYEGDRNLGMLPYRFEVRMQHDAQTGEVTGGGSVEAGADSGNWRDHEIAALYNVLAVARSEQAGVRVKLSFDRGATFAQEDLLAPAAGLYTQSRLVQVAMALDYSLAVVFWQGHPTTGALELKLCEGHASAFDGNGSPTAFAFGPPRVLQALTRDASPLISGVAWSDGGDLVIGFGASTFGPNPGGGWRSITSFHCAVRRYGESFIVREVDREELVGYDPSVAVLGQGSSLRVFYGYETRTGVRLAVSVDGGMTYDITQSFGGTGAHSPMVFARQDGSQTRVDMLYLAMAPAGRELHHARWSDWGQGGRTDYRLTTAAMAVTPASPGRPTPYGMTGPYDFGLRTTQINWLGFDAVRDGDEIVVVYDEVRQDSAYLCLALWSPLAWGMGNQTSTGLSSPSFASATPPPLAPGMTQPMPVVDPEHSHQLKLLRLQ